jgi:hypothetical protein
MMTERDETVWLCENLDGLLAADSPDERWRWVFEHPVLLSAKALELLQRERPGDPETGAALRLLDETRTHLWDRPEDYPLGHGPLEAVAAALREGEIGYDEAVERARAPERAAQLSHTYLRALLLAWVEEVELDAGFGLSLANLALESARAMPLPRLATDVMRATAEGFIRLVHGALLRRPDGAALRRALEVGEWALDDAEEQGRPALKGAYLQMMGAMLLDSYAANFGPSADFPEQVRGWLARASEPMPDASDGLTRARDHLADAVDLRAPGSPRGKTRKALLEAEIYRAFSMGKEPDPDTVSTLAGEALADLDPAADAPHVARVVQLRDVFGGQ